MIFALLDYIDFIREKGRYGEGKTDATMAVAFRDSVPSEVVDELQLGDLIFTQRRDTFLSWGTMYFPSSTVDHCALYESDGNVVHMTLAGLKRHSLRTLAKGARILIVRFDTPDRDGQENATEIDFADFDALDDLDDSEDRADDGGYLNRKRRMSHVLPPKLQLVFVALRIMTGCYLDRYRVKFTIDIVFLAALIDVPLYLLTGWVVAFTPAIVAIIITAVNLSLRTWAKHRGRGYELLSHPDLLLRSFFRHGGIMFTTLGTLSVSELGLIPLQVFLRIKETLGLNGQGSDDRADDDFDESS